MGIGADPIGATPMGHMGHVGGWVTGRIRPIGFHDAHHVGVDDPKPFAPHDHDGFAIGRGGRDVGVRFVHGVDNVVAFGAPIGDTQIGIRDRAIGDGVYHAVDVIGGFNIDVHGVPIMGSIGAWRTPTMKWGPPNVNGYGSNRSHWACDVGRLPCRGG